MALDLTYLSKRNDEYGKRTVTVANGTRLIALDMPEAEALDAREVLYLHINRENHKCYVGVTIMRAGDRWNGGIAYRFNRRFGAAIKKWGWYMFEHHILAFIEDRDAMNKAEIEAIRATGGHKSKFTYNLSPGGDTVAENDKPLIGVNLDTGETTYFNSGAEAAREIGLKNPDMPMAVARKERTSVAGWWFRFLDDETGTVPGTWGEELRVAQVREKKGKRIIAINFQTKEERLYLTTTAAAKALGLSQSSVSEVARGDMHSAGGWWFKFEDDTRNIPESFGTSAAREKRDRTVYGVHFETGERRTFRNCTVAANELGLYGTAAAAVAGGKRTSAKGWWFTYDETEVPPSEYKGSLVAKIRSKAVIAENLSTGESQRFDSAKLASEALGVHRSSISCIINGKAKSVKGYTFRLADGA